MGNRDNEAVVDLAVQALERNTKMRADVVKHEPNAGYDHIDAVIEILHGQTRYTMAVEVIQTISETQLGHIREMQRSLQEKTRLPCVLVTHYVPAILAGRLRDLGIQFVDTAGNAYLQCPDFTMSVRGEPRPHAVIKRERSGRALQPSGLMLVFQLLCDPGLASATYRDLAKRSGVSLRTVKLVVDDLKDKGYLQEGDNGRRRLRNAHRLLDEWSIAYRDRLLHQRTAKRFTARRADWWQDVDLKGFPACWTGEVAAAKLGFLRNPQKQTLVVWGNINQILTEHGMRQSADGPVEVIEAWWQADAKEIAPLVLVYADLMTSGEERNIEAAGELYKEKLAHGLT